MQAKLPSDPVIDEVREVRHRISARFGHDPERLVAYYMQQQQQFGDRMIDRETPAAVDRLAAEPDAVPVAARGQDHGSS